MPAKRIGRSKTHFRKVVVRCQCGKSLATVRVSRGGMVWVQSKGISFDLSLGSEEGEGGDSVRCTDRDCKAGPRYFPDGDLMRMIEKAAKRGEKSLKLDLPKG